jgi:outer membrane protein OmpA-like peptidoglycan-associated protein
MLKRVSMAMVVALSCAAAALAQAPPAGPADASPRQETAAPAPSPTTTAQQPTTPATTAQPTEPALIGTDDGETRPATTTFMGDTGLWFVPTGEILPARKWSFSLYRVNFDYNQGFTDVSNWPVTFGVGLGDRAELFAAVTAVRRIDRDVRPLFIPTEPGAGGLANEYPFVRQGWSDNQFGDVWIGAKINLTSEYRQHPAAFALRGLIKLPTAKDDDEGVGTGKADFAFDAILSKEVNERVELSGFGGLIFRGDPDGLDLSNGFRWGFGAGFPSRRQLRLTAELHGEGYFDDSLEQTRGLIATDGTIAPAITNIDSPFNASLGLTWQGRNGVFVGAGVNWRVKMDGRNEFGGFEDETGDSLGFQFRLGYHPGVRIFVPPPPPLPPPPPAAPEHVLTVKAQCNPCTVEIGRVSTVTAFPQSSIGCTVTYQWTAPTGKFTNPTGRETPWTAPMQEGTVPVTVTVTCPSDQKTATDTVNIQVVRPVVKQFVFEDVHFDFDRYSLRPEATRALDEVVKTMQENPELTVEVEGHTCNIGTAEYNLALGERRSVSVREYLTGRGIAATRLRTVSYGEERPKHDNAREETRRLNRRAAMVVRLQK